MRGVWDGMGWGVLLYICVCVYVYRLYEILYYKVI